MLKTSQSAIALWLPFLVAVVFPCAARGEGTKAAEDWLRQEKGLTRSAGGVWMLSDETRLRNRLDELPKMRDRMQQMRLDLDAQIRENRRRWVQIGPQVFKLQRRAAELETGDMRRRTIEQQIDRLLDVAAAPENLGGKPPVRSRLVALSNDMHQMALSVNWIRATVPALTRQYEQLGKETEVVDALARQQGANRLGPVRSYQPDLERLAEYEKLAMTSAAPLFMQSGQYRITALVNDRAPIAFTWNESNEPTLITSSAAELAGIDTPPDARRFEHAIGKKRTLRVALVDVPSIRVGRHVLQNTSAYVLPPEGEDVGCRIGQAGFKDLRARLQPRRLRLAIEAGD